MAERIEADACVVGAGYAGLVAARQLQGAGRTVAVVEARDRIGGRVWTDPLSDGTRADRGGAWLGHDHHAMRELATEMGVSTFKTHVAGAHLLVDGERTRRYTGLIPKISPMAVASIAWAQLRIDRMSRQVPIEAPWEARRAAEWDARSVASWLARSGVRTQIGRDLFEMAVRGLMTGDLEDISLLHLLFLVRAHGSINRLFSIDGGAQENLFEGGAGLVAERIADELGEAVHLNAPVRRIVQGQERVEVSTDRLVVSARQVVVSVPPALALDIDYDPALPDDRRALYRAAVAGPETKTLVVYDEPFWRAAGLSGQTAGPRSAAEVTIDASATSGGPGVLASFSFGPVAERLDALDPVERRQAVLAALAARLGDRAARPEAFVETPWWHEQWTQGCSMAHFPLGILTRYGHLLRRPFGRIHWAGTETSTVSHGSIDGAVRSGQRAASEILEVS